MGATESAQAIIIKTLYANRQAVNARFPVAREMTPICRLRVGLQRHLQRKVAIKFRSNRVQHASDSLRREPAGRAPAKKHAFDDSSLGDSCHSPKFSDQALHISCFLECRSRMSVEIAVWATRDAPGKVRVQRQRNHVLACRCSIKARSAAPRWLMPFLTSGSNSAEAQPCVGT